MFASAAMLIAVILLAQKNETTPLTLRWKTVEELAEKQLPESALKEVDDIIAIAKKEKNTAQLIKAMLYKMRFSLDIDPDKAPQLIREFEEFTNNETATDEKALLYSMTAELYARYYLHDVWTINKRTQVAGNVPDDLKEWTKNIYFDKITKLLRASLQSATLLQNTNLTEFEALIEKGEDSQIFQPTLYDFLAYRRINLLQELSQATDLKNPLNDALLFSNAAEFATLKQDSTYINSIENQIIETYQQLINFHLKSPHQQALIHTDLKRLQYLKEQTQNNSLYFKALKTLETNYATNELVVEIWSEKANYYIQNQDETTAKISNKRKAYEICKRGIKKFPTYRRINLLKNLQKQISQKNLSILHKELVRSKAELELTISYSNLNVLVMNVYRVNASAHEYYEHKQNQHIQNASFPHRTLVESRTLDLKQNLNFAPADTTITLQTGDYGIYEVNIQEKLSPTTNIQKSKTVFAVSDLGFIQRTSNASLQNLYVLNRETGTPLAKAKVTAYQNRWNGNGYKLELKNSLFSDNNGLCKIPFENRYSDHIFFIELGNDKYFSSSSYSYFNEDMPYVNEKPQLNLFTDRSLYRPGQVVYFKGIAYYSNKNKQEVQKSASYEVTLYDTNHQKVSSKTLKTNEFGSFAGEFVLPDGGLNGAYRIQAGRFSETIFVEEYKRPTFEVIVDKPKAEIRFGSKVTLSANVKAFAGYNIGSAKVKYRITRTSHRYCWWWHEPETEITTGTTQSDSNGKFEVSFIPEKPKTGAETWRGSFYTYTIKADVTDPKGETQTAEQSISVGDKSLFIIASMPEKSEKKLELSMDISTETLNGESIESVVEYEIHRMETLTDYIDNKTDLSKVPNTEKMISGKFNTKDKTLKIDVKKWKSAQYRIILKTKDAFGNEVKTENTTIIYDNADKSPAVKTYKWVQVLNADCAVGEKGKIRFGTSAKNTAVLYEIMQGNKIIESKWLKLNNEIRDFEIPFLNEYGAGVTVLFTYMKNERLFTEQVQLTRKVAEKKLTPTLSVFRNKLQPGEKAEWTISIPEAGKDKKAAELLVGMYDASLDAIRPHSWSFNPSYRESVSYSPSWVANNINTSSDYVHYENEQLEVIDFKLSTLNWFGLNISNINHNGFMIRGVRANSQPVMIADVAIAVNEERVYEMKGQQNAPMLNEVVTVGYGTQKKTNKSETEQQQQVKPKIRTNFNETAFFYPQLRTDAQGKVKFSFTAPESLTRWNVNMLAHTADLYVGQKQEQVVTQKDLMVQMNLPRFVRRSDKLTLSANVINLTDKDITANVVFELIDPATEKIIFNQSKSVEITTSSNSSPQGEGAMGGVVSFDIPALTSTELVICKMVATAGNFSDGEQKYLPVLPDKVLVTESLPLIIRSNETRKFTFESLLKNAANVETRNLTVEFASNPAWYAVQALPTLSAPESDNAIDYFTAYYTNTLASYIANSNPKIAKVFDQWKNATGSRDALISNLQKNTELKNMLLEETPWVMAAQDETEQKRQIALLFDLNMQKNQGQQYLDKLLKLQTQNGGFTWYTGMMENRYITQEIVLNFARLNRMIGGNILTDYAVPITSALHYLDLEIARDFADLKRYNKEYLKQNCIGSTQLFYLFLRSEYPNIAIDESAKEAVKYYSAQSEKYWTSFSLYDKALFAIVAHRNGNMQTSNLVLKSLKENALKTDEFGMYWARNTSGYFWNERPIAVQAAIIEAFTLINPIDRVTQSHPVNNADVDEMKIWLLKQKQTQRWNSPTATVNAIYALLLQGTDWLANGGKVEIKLGGKTLEPRSTEAGTGYFKETIPVGTIKPEMGKIEIGWEVENHPHNSSKIGWEVANHPHNSSIKTVRAANSLPPSFHNSSKTVRAANSLPPSFGAIYWQYYQDLDKVEAQGGALKISKKLFVKTTTEGFTQSETLNNNSTSMIPIEQAQLKKGDKIITRLVITTDRNLEFVALKDLRAACLEPVEQRSGYVWREGIGYYQTTKDASTQFFFNYLPKGTYVFEYEQWVNNSGTFTSGIASVQCQYAPEFVSHSRGEQFIVK